VTELEAFRDLSGSTEQHPVLADCYRALGRHAKVVELWEELRNASPSAALVAEGRIVYAGSLADQGRLAEAASPASSGPPPARHVRPRRPARASRRRAAGPPALRHRRGRRPRARRRHGPAASPQVGESRGCRHTPRRSDGLGRGSSCFAPDGGRRRPDGEY
jgi:hypothetical protein